MNDLTKQLQSDRLVDPHSILGLHPVGEGKEIRIWRPDLAEIAVCVRGETVRGPGGLFVHAVPADLQPLDYQTLWCDDLIHDPYAFPPTFGPLDEQLFSEGRHYDLYRCMGARRVCHQGVEGTLFAVWAPLAQRVALVGDRNGWDDRLWPMRRLGASGVWELFVPGVSERYKFAITTQAGEVIHKVDPFAHFSEVRPKNASVVFDVDGYSFQSPAPRIEGPISIYEVHLGSWKRHSDGSLLSYRELAVQLADYCVDLGFTHVELLPITEHPLDESWGYQVSGYFAPTSRFGTPADFQYFVDHLHSRGLGIFLDWVPGHFPMDSWSLGEFDGSCLYEHVDPRQGHHPHWGTKIFNFGRREVANFLIASALYWLDVMRIDGLRVDAVESMLFLDYGREEGEWIPNGEGGNLNLDAIDFFRHLSSVVRERHPEALLMAEDSSTFPGVTGELGFDYKWDLGWMHDTLRYLQADPRDRSHLFHHLTFGHTYRYSERHMLPLSHDEVVHLKKSLLSKMPGDAFGHLRLLLSYLFCQPGPKLLFMGGEFGQVGEWDALGQLEWQRLEQPEHRDLQAHVRKLNAIYRTHPALWGETDENFAWVRIEEPVLAYWRRAPNESLLCVHNFSDRPMRCFLPVEISATLLGQREPRAVEGGVEVELDSLETQILA